MERSVYININPVYTDFLRFIFKAEKNAPIYIDSVNDIGKLILALVEKSNKPVKRDISTNDVCFIVPNKDIFHFQRYFLFLTRESEAKLNFFIESYFNNIFFMFMNLTYQSSILQKKAIDLFIREFNLNPDNITYDALIKKDYRNRKKIENLFLNYLKLSNNQ